jgi:RNA polymerase primary sigma factor
MARAAGTGSDSDALQAYLRAIARLPRLTVEEERELARLIQQGDQQALRRLVEGNLRFVVSYARRYRGLGGVPFIDLINEGNLGLMEAARRFDPDRNVKFITYAVWWVRQAIMHVISTQSRAFTLPQKLAGSAARQAYNDLSLSERIGAGRGDEEGPELGELLESADPPVEETLVRRALTDRVRAALDELDDKEKEVVGLRFGLDRDGEMRTLQEIGHALDLSRERVRQIEARAKEKLRRSKRAGELRSYLN